MVPTESLLILEQGAGKSNRLEVTQTEAAFVPTQADWREVEET